MERDPVIVRARRLARRLAGRRDAAQERPVIPHALLELDAAGPAPLTGHDARDQTRLSIAIVIPSFRRGSGGHMTIVNLATALTARGHQVSLWLEDFERLHAGKPAANIAGEFASFFAAPMPLNTSFAAWAGADVVVATGWETVPRVLRLPGAAGRAYLVQDHEPEFYGTSAQALLAADTYRRGLHCIAASSWLAELLRTRYGASATHFDLAVDHGMYRPSDTVRDAQHIVFYARTATERRAVPLGLLALEELAHRRPGIQIDLFGSHSRPYAPFPHRDLGVLGAAQLAGLYRRATVGMVFSLTNPSLIGLEMMACGLPCVELDSEPIHTVFSEQGPLTLAAPAADDICSRLEMLLDDPDLRADRGRSGTTFMQGRTWDGAADQLERGLRAALGSPS